GGSLPPVAAGNEREKLQEQSMSMQTRMQNETDNQLRNAVAIQIDWEPEVSSRDISVSAHDGVITLTGFVHNYFEKVAAERAAKSVYGVKAVANDIEVRAAGARTDPEIARDIVHAMKADVTIPDDRIKVGVKDGYVTLDGNVNWNYQRTKVADISHRINGVRDITNNITVQPSVTPTDVKEKIEGALKRNAELDARRISVSVENGTVQLYGNVRSWFEREEAERAAWGAPGVSKVVDHISIVP
ncbi:MAG TPA: BON domain-containing protein, partial [Bryobacteraceae bacterium]|nr:BON domain-containing protein [Bryobacteraceae bacterium]